MKTNSLTSLLLIILTSFHFFEVRSQIFNINKAKKRLKIEYSISKRSTTNSSYIDVFKTKKIKPEKTAIVLIDIWNEIFLTPMINEFVNPLIKEADSLGIHVIYAPSKGKLNKHLEIIENSITFYDLAIMDDYINQNKIENIIYVGFDALYCVIDKPNGIFSFRKRNHKNLNYYVFDKGINSYTKEMKETALALYKKNNIGVIKSDHITYKNIYPKKTINDPYKKTTKGEIPGKKMVLFFKKSKTDFQNGGFIDSLKEAGIIYAEVLNEKLYYKDNVISHSYEFIEFLLKNKIRNIFYAGYYLNNEILWSNFGIIHLYSQKRYSKISKLPKTFIINDLSYISKDANIKKSVEKSVIINHYRDLKNILSKQLFTCE